jgi:lipoyl(octanoyl) transferase
MRFSNHYWGMTEYSKALEIQKNQVEKASYGDDAFLIGFEHPTVVTLGVRGGEKDLNLSKEAFEKKCISVVRVERGGEATLHSPGQLVIYPILPIKIMRIEVREFVRKLEEATIAFFSHFGVDCQRGKQEPGLYTASGKIAFIGIRVDRGVTYHGLAINAFNDLSLFQMIRSCGVQNESFDSLKNHGINASQAQLFDTFSTFFQREFFEKHANHDSFLTAVSDRV